MKIIFITVFLIFQGCQLIPEKLIFSDESQREYYLQLDDTLSIDIDSLSYGNLEDGIFTIIDYGDTNILSVEQSQLMVSFIGKEVGSNIVKAEFLTYESKQLIYLNFIVVEGTPINIYVGEYTHIHLTDFTEIIQDKLDSSLVNIFSNNYNDGINTFSWTNNSNYELILKGIRPGTEKIFLTLTDVLDSENVFYFQPIYIESILRKIVTVELFTNTGCMPCKPVNHFLDEIMYNYSQNVNMVRYHWNTPVPNDPMYLYNSEDVEFRRSMYGIPFCPVAMINGVHLLAGQNMIIPDANSLVLSEISESSQLYLGHTTFLDGDSISVDVQIRPYQDINEVVKVWATVVEDSVEYLGENGELIHMQVMRHLDSSNIFETLAKDEIYTSNIVLSKPPGYSEENSFFYIVTFLQSTENNRVYQSNRLYSPF